MTEFERWDLITKQGQYFTVIDTQGDRIMAVDDNGLVKFLWADDVEVF